MFKKNAWAGTVRAATTVALIAGGFSSAPIYAEEEELIEEVIVTGSRIKRPGNVSTSPIFSIDSQEITFQQDVEVEQILRELPSTISGDGSGVNNGTGGAATIDLRGLGPERNLVLLNGRRMTPFNHNGRVDTSTIPTALIKRIDVVTGGASAVYGSDAIAGAINIVLNEKFQGFELSASGSETGENDGEVNKVSVTLGSELMDGRGNFAVNMSWAEREGVTLGQRPLGQLGINTSTGSGLAEFQAGQPPAPSTVTGCNGPNVVDITGSGSTTAIPTRVAIAGAGSVGQFLDDRSLYTANRPGCSRFNFNPFNFYRTPQERYNLMGLGNLEFNDHFEAYSTFEYSNITVDAQVAPSGTFGALFDVPLANPFFSDQARNEIISFANAGVTAGTLSAGTAGSNWNDVNGNGVVDAADYLKLQLRRRTLELGPRTERFDNDHFMLLVGARGEIYNDWSYDVSYQYGESNRTTVRDGYTNLTNIQTALDTTSTTTCTNSSDSTCVPIDLFGGFGTITPQMAGFARAIALQQQKYEQRIATLIVDGPLKIAQSPFASEPLQLSFGYEKRDEFSTLTPDECLKLAPASCQGGAGGNLLPIAGGFKVDDLFMEGLMPLVEGKTLAKRLDLEFGFRSSDYSTVGTNETYKVGLNWSPIDSLLVRVMQQEATRAPNVGELFSPVTTGLDNAQIDPCSVANAGNIDAALTALCISTGMLAAQVGQVQDIVSAQVNILQGSNPTQLPKAETAETFTAGFVWTPDFEFLSNSRISVDYYDIDIEDTIGEFSAQQTLDQCYKSGRADACAQIVRIDGDLTSPSSGIQLFTTNLKFLRAEGIEVAFNFGLDLPDEWGTLQFSGSINKYLKNESQSDALTPVIDCNGIYGSSCTPVSEISWVQRTTWNFKDLSVSLNWRHIGEIDIEDSVAAGTFAEFRSIDSYDYLDLYAGYSLFDDQLKLSVGIDNVTEEEAPIVGNDAGSTSFNSGNTFPSTYDVLGRVYTVGITYSL